MLVRALFSTARFAGGKRGGRGRAPDDLSEEAVLEKVLEMVFVPLADGAGTLPGSAADGGAACPYSEVATEMLHE